MPTPCLNRCRLDAAGAACLDCGRTLAEIAAWGGLDTAARLRIMAELPERRRRAAASRWRQCQQQP